jgi:hypothetical protein
MTTATTATHPFRVACDDYTITARTAEAAQRLADGIEKLDACRGVHRVEEFRDGGWQPATTVTTLEDGTEVRIKWNIRDRFRGLDADGDQAVSLFGPDEPVRDEAARDYVVPLTPCCNASGKGSPSPTGVVCRACYQTVSPKYGGSTEIAPGKAVAR